MDLETAESDVHTPAVTGAVVTITLGTVIAIILKAGGPTVAAVKLYDYFKNTPRCPVEGARLKRQGNANFYVCTHDASHTYEIGPAKITPA